MRFFLLIGILSVFFSCGTVTSFDCEQQRINDKERISNQVIGKIAKRLKEEMVLIPIGFGGQMMDQIKQLEVSFAYRRYPMNIKESRKLLMHAMNLFLDEINSNEKIRPYLDHYPFEPKNVTIEVFLEKSDGSFVNVGDLVVISARKGVFQYKFEGSDHSNYLKTFREPYEQVLRFSADYREND